MNGVIAICCALGSAACFGCGDFLAQGLTRRHGSLSAMLAVQIASALMLGLTALLWHGPPPVSTADLLPLLLLGLGNTVGIIGLYRAFEIGQLSLVSPIAGSMGAFAVAFAWLAGEPLTPSSLPALALVVAGIVVASVIREPADQARGRPSTHGRALGVGWALLSALALGWVFFALAPSSARIGPAWVLWVLRLVAIACLWPLFRRVRREPESARAFAPGVLAVAALDSFGMLLYAVASSQSLGTGQLATVAVIASSFPLVTIALAHLRLRESLRWWQWVGVSAVLGGVAWLSV